MVSYLAYPIGFIAVVIGRAQLFTENTLYPVIRVLDEHRYLLQTLRLWLVVFASNILRAMLFGLLAIKSGALLSGVAEQLVTLGDESTDRLELAHLLEWRIGGWLIALVAWS